MILNKILMFINAFIVGLQVIELMDDEIVNIITLRLDIVPIIHPHF